jgi:hypothetical protein
METSEIADPPHDAHATLPRRRTAQGVIIGLAVLAVIAGVLGLILLSPLMLRGIDSIGGADWTRLSEIGQTYGAASAILSALALGGVAVSLFFQARQARAQQIQMVREYYRELVRMTLEDPEVYLPCHRPIKVPGLDLNGQRQHLFMRLRMNYAAMATEVGVLNEATLRGDLLEGIFQGTAGREYWKEARHRLAVNPRPATRRFVRIVDEEYNKAVAAGPPVMGRTLEADRRSDPGGTRDVRRSSSAALLGLGAGVLLGLALRRQKT